MYDDFFSKAHELTQAGQAFATATVVRAEKPTSGKPGDKAIVTLGGELHGWIGGSCAQPAVVREALEAIAEGDCRLIRLSPNPGESPAPAGIKEVAMTCFSGGTLDIYIEPQQPKPSLMVVGNLPVARAIVHLGKAMSYRVLAVDPEAGRVPEDGAPEGRSLEDSVSEGNVSEGSAPKASSMAHADVVLTDLEEISRHADSSTYVVVATHGHFDELALERALRSPAPYVGLVASRKRAVPILEYLRSQGVGEEELARLKAPAGLDIGARRGDEIALSIVAEIVECRRGEVLVTRKGQARRDSPEPAADGGPRPTAEAAGGCCSGAAEAAPSTTAKDPVCGMTVEVEGAANVFEYAGQAYHFCCGGCRSRFVANPVGFVASD